MEYYDWLIISNAIILIGFLTLLGLALLETTFRDTHKWVLWFSVGGTVLFIILTTLLVWYHHDDKNKNKKKNGQVSVNNVSVQKEEKRVVPVEYKDKILVNSLKSDINKDKEI